MTKRTKIQSLFALLLAFVMVVGGFFSPVFAEEAEDAEEVDAETEATEQEERINYDDLTSPIVKLLSKHTSMISVLPGQKILTKRKLVRCSRTAQVFR